MLGGILLGVVGELAKLTSYSGSGEIVVFVVLIAVLLVRPRGILGEPITERS